MSDRPIKKPTLEARKLRSLVRFPAQDALFPPCSPEEDESLAENIRSEKLRDPIHILPDNSAGFAVDTILFGHRRRDALLRIGKTSARVLVRYDLAEADALTIEKLFIDDNDERRQLSKLGKARVALRRFEIERRREPGELNQWEERDARDRVGQAIGMSGRNLQRYVNILRAPMSVQQAFESGELTLTQADRISRLPEAVVAEIDDHLRTGGDAGKLLKRYLTHNAGSKASRGTAITRFIGVVEKAVQELDGRDLADVKIRPRKGELAALRSANRACVQLIRAFKASRNRDSDLIGKVRD